MDVPALQVATLIEEGLASIILAADQSITWPVLIACSARAEFMGLAVTRPLLCSFRQWISVLPVWPT